MSAREYRLSVIDFNPRSREGSDTIGIPADVGPGVFQSTLP